MRFIISIMGAVVISLFFFWFMQTLISLKAGDVVPVRDYEIVEAVYAKPTIKEEKVEDKVLALKEKMSKSMELPGTPRFFDLKIPIPDLPSLNIDIPDLQLTQKLSGFIGTEGALVSVKGGGRLGGGLGGRGGGDGLGDFIGGGRHPFHDIIIIPHGTIMPPYPDSAASRKIEGWILVEFTITKDGWVKDVIVLDSEPRGIFEQTTVNSVYTWKYRRLPAAVRASQYIEFTLDQLEYYQGQ